MYPPFTVKDFRSALPLSEAIGIGVNRARHGLIAGKHYLIREVTYAHTLFVWAGSNLLQPANPARYAVSASAAASDIAQALGLGDHVAPAYAFSVDKRHYLVSAYIENACMLTDVLHLDEHNHIINAHEFPSAQLQPLVLYEQILGDTGRSPADYLADPQTKRIYETNLTRSFRFTDRDFCHSPVTELARAQSADPDQVPLDRSVLQATLAQEDTAIAILQNHHLDMALPRVRLYFRHLAALATAPGAIHLANLKEWSHR